MKWPTSFSITGFTFLILAIVDLRCQSQGTNIPRPDPSRWGRNPNRTARAEEFLNWLILGCDPSRRSSRNCEPATYRHVEYSGYDGFYNNLAKPTQGAIDTPLLRLLPPVYHDGVYQPVERPANPISVSEAVMKGDNGKTSRSGNTAFLLFFGQQVVEEVLDAQRPACPPEYFNIPIPEDHEYATTNPGVPVLPLLRTRYDATTGFSPNNPRQQINEITPYIDGGLVYGAAKGWTDILRLRADGTVEPNGKLASHSTLGPDFPAENSHRLPMANPPPPTNHSEFVKREFTAPVDRFFKLGNPRGNENPFLLTFGIFWYRWHNVIAEFLKRKYPQWDGERIFNEARKWVIATQQSVTMYDWLPKYLKTNPSKYSEDVDGRTTKGYNPTVDPQISHVFQSAAMRFGHTLVPSGVYLRDKVSDGCGTSSFSLDPNRQQNSNGHTIRGVRTCNSFWRSPELFKAKSENFERFLMGMSSQSTEEEDNIIVEDLRGRVFGPLEFSRRDLMAVNIQRGRDHGLPDYNTARKHFGLATLESLSVTEFIGKTKTNVTRNVLEKLREVYNNDPSQVDIWAGGLLETKNGPGELFTAIIKDQFERIRDGDRFWFENRQNELFQEDEIDRIYSVKIIDLILSIANITLADIQNDPFTAPRVGNDVPDCQSQYTESSCLVYNPDQNMWDSTTCKYLPPLDNNNLEPCTQPQTYDYFSGSVISFILTFLFAGVAIVAVFVWVNAFVVYRGRKKRTDLLSTIKVKEGEFKCKERVAFFERRVVIVSFNAASMQILVKSNIGKVLRVLDATHLKGILMYHTADFNIVLIRAENHYDLCLIVNDEWYGQQILEKLSEFCNSCGKTLHAIQKSKYQINHDVITFKDREEQLNQVLQSVLELQRNSKYNPKKSSGSKKQVSKIRLTKTELADALGMTIDSSFFKQFFYLMDKDKSGFISFQEFMSVMTMFTRGTDDEKAQLFFNIYDIDHSNYLTAEDFKMIIESVCSSEVKDQTTDQIVNTLLESVGVGPEDKISFEKFCEIYNSGKMFRDFNPMLGTKMGKEPLKRQESTFSLYADIGAPDSSASTSAQTKPQESYPGQSFEESSEESSYGKFGEMTGRFNNYIIGKDKLLFWGFLYTAVMLLIFAERAYYYSVEREHAGLRRIAGYGVTVTRGAASAIMFTYSTLLITMCRNTLSYLRSSFVHKYVPFDQMVGFHKYIGWWALFWTLVHVVGHAINFYHISTQTSSDLTCLFRNFFRSTHIIPKFHYWCWETVTGLTGVFLTIQVAIIYIFAAQARKQLYQMFWLTHNTYPLLYFLMILHGSGALVQPPFFHFFFLGPIILFVLDKIVSISRKTIKIEVIGAKHLPSNVTLLRISRPYNFSYHSGQWIRIASVGINMQEFHPFTISSAPHEKDLTLHIRGVGPWTNAIRKVYPDYENIKSIYFKYPEVYIDGPFGEGHQMWWNHEIVIFVGGGIGVTPFASILKDITFKSNQTISSFRCKKVIFLWVTRSQKQFEWMTDILRQVEEADVKKIISNHIFITQFKSKYDFRTTMLYHAERHFQKLSGRSIITGLRAVTHFSRPNFTKVFEAIKKRNSKAPIIGVFTCGGLTLSSSVDAAVRDVNKADNPVLTHYYENF